MTIRILYVITNYYRNGWYCGFNPPFSDRIYYKEQMIIVERMKKISRENKKISLTLKLHPGADVLDEDPPWVASLKGIERINIIRNPIFTQLLHSHDVVLIDSPTTTLLQAIATRLPVFVLTSVISPPRVHLHLLMKRAVCADHAEALMNRLEVYLQTGEYPADCDNREYIKLYGTHIDDGKSSQRALAVLKRTLQGGRR
ncbi:MAG: hypothetical protein ABIJ37_02490 [Pseudomonadota bacterium]